MMAFLLMFILIVLMFVVSIYQNKMMDMLMMYECGFSGIGMVRSSFSFRFFLIAILFVVFDIEIILMLVVPYMDTCSINGLVLYYFLAVLLLGLMYEMSYGVLNWAEVLN